jgi:glycosyltransferase involved in cell wall biosynthesis
VQSWFSPPPDRCDKLCTKGLASWETPIRVRFLGFINQSALPAVYKAEGLMVLHSEYEPFAVVVNEASCCRCPVAASDQVGATTDFIAPVNPDFVFPCGDVPFSPNYCKERFSIKLNWAGAGRIPFE